MTKVFFDASVIFSAIYSIKGGSRKLTDLVKRNNITGITTQTVIEELEDNIGKFKTREINLKQFITENNFIVREKIKESEAKSFLEIVHAKDAHILTGAILTRSDYLVTLDKRHLDNPSVKAKISKVKIVSPKELLELLI